MKCTPIPLYKISQCVWLFTKSWQPQVLKVQWIGSFKIREVLYNACCLCLPLMLKIHPVVNVTYLKPTLTVLPSNPKRVMLANPHNMTDKE